MIRDMGPDNASAQFSECRCYRYTLERQILESGPTWNFIMLNPSTADAFVLDPTIRRCMNFARVGGAGHIVVTNLFAFRATDPRDMRASLDPIGPHNDGYLWEVAQNADVVVCAWGTHGVFKERNLEVLKLLRLDHEQKLFRLGPASKDGHPKHPLYLPSDLALEPQ